jgi:hypothetical protein
MSIFIYKLHLRDDEGEVGQRKASQKEQLECVINEFKEKGACIINIHSTVAKIGVPLKTINQVTITYDAPEPINHEKK